jgi:hypothetical protein
VKWRYAIVALILLLLAGARAAIGVPQDPSPSQEFTGHVDIATGPDGRLLVLIDVETSSQSSDGLVDQVFRFQEAPALTYSGPATVTYVKNRVTVQVAQESGWVFTVGGWPMPPADTAFTEYHVKGIARLWGDTIHKSAVTLFATLSAVKCSKPAGKGFSPLSADDGGPACKNCQTGGPGVSGCSMSCSDGSSCSADCDDTTFACCNCPSACGCCSNKEGGSAHH